MTPNLSPFRTVAALGATMALTLVACGGDDDDADTTPAAADAPSDDDAATEQSGDDAGATTAAAMQPSTITADAQTGDGTAVTIASVDLPAPGFIAVHGDGGGSPGPVIGVSDLLSAGISDAVTVTLAEPLGGDATVYPMVHIDTDGNGLYEFGSVDGVDGPGLTADGDVAVVPADVTVDGSGDGGNAAPASITIADFAFSGVTEVAIGTTVVVTNDDGAAHTWSAVDDTFDSGTLDAGESFEFTFTEAGEFEYFCNFHPSMTGTIVVTG